MSLTLVPNPFGPFLVGHGVELAFQVWDYTIASKWTAKDISAARWTYRVRAYDETDDTSMLYDEVLTKSSEDASGGIRHYLSLGATVRPLLTWYIVEVDNDTADATTPTGFRETPQWGWRVPVEDTPLTVPA